jgi:radical SAM superfamily enzyme YgiQ (UPF0313 family)
MAAPGYVINDHQADTTMKKPKLLIIVLFQNLRDAKPYYARTPSPPLPGILLAAMTPPLVEVEVLHEMVRPIDYKTNADFVALSFMDYLAPHAYEVAAKFRAMGKVVVGGGKFASTFPDEVEPHFDSILVGEAQNVWPQMVRDMVNGTLQKRYYADPAGALDSIPPPRYDLVESKYTAPIVTEASRGCPHPCTYCALNIKRTPYRTRPIADVIRDLTNTRGLPWFKRKMAMILDNNLGGDLQYAKALLRELARLKFWAVGTQFSVECLRDNEFIELLAQARCHMAFIGMESLNDKSLEGVKKRQNKAGEYKELFDKLHRRGILTFTGLMIALDDDTEQYYATLPEKLKEVGTCVILPSISIPIYGTPWYQSVAAEGRVTDRDLSHYEGDHLVFRHKHLSPEQIYAAYRHVAKEFYSWTSILRRWVNFLSMQERVEPPVKFLLKIFLTTFIYFKLSIFQRHHAQKRVFPKLRSRNEIQEGNTEATEEITANNVCAMPWAESPALQKAS